MNIDKVIRQLNQIKVLYPNAKIECLSKIGDKIRYVLEDEKGSFVVFKSVKGR